MNKLSIVMYHYVRDLKASRFPNIKGLDLKLFKQQIEFFKKNFNLVSVHDVEKAINNEKNLPNNSLLLTFDDGYIDHYTNVFPILLKNNLSAFFSMPAKIIRERKVLDVNKIHFILASVPIKELLLKVYERLDYYRGNEFKIPTNKELYDEVDKTSRFDSEEIVFIKTLLQYKLPCRLRNLIVDDLFTLYIKVSEEAFCNELYMNYDQIKLMKDNGMVFGIHGYDHNWLGELSYNDMVTDVNKALDVYEEIIDRKNWIMCAPYGSYNDNMIQYIKENGCKFGLGTEVGVADLENHNIYKLKRFDTNDFPPISHGYNKYII